MDQPTLILITNDDGFEAPGIRHLAEYVGQWAEVVVAAPDGPRSGQSSAITVDAPLYLTRRPDIGRAKVWSVNGTPVDCVKLAMHALFKDRRPDMILSGINHGSNSGNSVLYSGTMGAVLEGCTLGIPSVGFSLLDHNHDADFSGCTRFVDEIARGVAATGLPSGVRLNVNIPAGCVPKGMKVVKASQGYWTDEYSPVTEADGRTAYRLTGRYVDRDPDDDTTDNYWLGRGYVTVVPTCVDMTAPLKDLHCISEL